MDYAAGDYVAAYEESILIAVTATGYRADLDPGLATELLGQARLAVTDAFRGRDGQALFAPAVEALAGPPAGRSAGPLPREAGVAAAGPEVSPCRG